MSLLDNLSLLQLSLSDKLESFEKKETETITKKAIRNRETEKRSFFLKLALKLSNSSKKNTPIEKTRPKSGLLDPIEGKTSRAKIIKIRNKGLKRLDEKKSIPKKRGNKADKQAPKEFGSLKVELI